MSKIKTYRKKASLCTYGNKLEKVLYLLSCFNDLSEMTVNLFLHMMFIQEIQEKYLDYPSFLDLWTCTRHKAEDLSVRSIGDNSGINLSISPYKHTLRVLIRSASLRHF